jgi:hypothetical protein
MNKNILFFFFLIIVLDFFGQSTYAQDFGDDREFFQLLPHIFLKK